MLVADQIARFISLGVPRLAGMDAGAFRELATRLPQRSGALVAVHPSAVPASSLAPLLQLNGKPGFVVSDMADIDLYSDIPEAPTPAAPVYLVLDVERGDDLRNWSPNEALVEITRRGRTPLALNEGICWLIAQPDLLVPNHCFMTIGSRKRKSPQGQLDARTPAIWISSGTGRDGPSRRGAPKVGWCWAGNRHTWLGFASATTRTA